MNSGSYSSREGLAVRSQEMVMSKLRLLIQEATCALAKLDANQLENLATACAALNRELTETESLEEGKSAREAAAATSDLMVFARVLSATRENLCVVRRAQGRRGTGFALRYNPGPELR